jgi:hypothetical protein
MAISELGTFTAHAIQRFKSLLHTTVKTALKVNPPNHPALSLSQSDRGVEHSHILTLSRHLNRGRPKGVS